MVNDSSSVVCVVLVARVCPPSHARGCNRHGYIYLSAFLPTSLCQSLSLALPPDFITQSVGDMMRASQNAICYEVQSPVSLIFGPTAEQELFINGPLDRGGPSRNEF